MVIISTIVLSGCYPGGAEYTSDTDIVVTSYNSDFDFKSTKYYYMPDSIRHITGDTTTEPDRSLDAFIIGELERNFEARGYVRYDTDDLDNGEEPDLIIVASASPTGSFCRMASILMLASPSMRVTSASTPGLSEACMRR